VRGARRGTIEDVDNQVRTETDWPRRRAAHEQRVDALLAEHLERRRTGVRHPVEDFLFTYYSYRPAQLRRWHPGAGVLLPGAEAAALGPEYVDTPAGAHLDVDTLLRKRRESVAWIGTLLSRTAGRAGQFACFGMHEWAMVYRIPRDQIRHVAWPLRLGAAGTAALVEQNRVRCTHFDAYRFFTPPARPLNVLRPTRQTQADNEQPGCLHANMDLYKWAYKLAPLVASELVADCFELARDIRVLDMRASPYDLSALGYTPVRVETPEGRAEYAAAQRGFAERAAALRDPLIESTVRLVQGSDEERPLASGS
jgi:hypothetical protein